MASSAQLAANAANARLSSGPKSDAGKSRSAQNARTHGFTAAEPQVSADQRSEFEQLQAELLAVVDPTNDLERDLTRQLIASAWKIHRLQAFEAEILSNETNPFLNETTAKALDRLNRYLTAAERSYHRTLKELHQLQTSRWIGRTDDLDPILPLLPRLADAARIKRLRSPQFAAKTTPSPKIQNEPTASPNRQSTVHIR